MTGMSTDSPSKPSMTHLRPIEQLLVHTKTTDTLHQPTGPLPKETNTTSEIKISMRKLSVSLELTRIPYQFHSLEEKELIQSTDGITSHQVLLQTSPKETPKISLTRTSMRKSSVSSDMIRT